MKSALLITALLAVFANALAQDVMASLQSHIPDCGEKLSAETIKSLHEGREISYKDMGCFVACLFTKAGIMTRAKINIQKLERQALESDDPEGSIQNIETLKQCRGKAEATSDECKVAEQYAACLKLKIGPRQ